MIVSSAGYFDLNQEGLLTPQQATDTIKQILDAFNSRSQELSDAQETALQAKQQKIEAMDKLIETEQTVTFLQQQLDQKIQATTDASHLSLEEAFKLELGRKENDFKRLTEYQQARYRELKTEFDRQRLLTPEIEYVKSILKEKKLLQFTVQNLEKSVRQLQRDLSLQPSTRVTSWHEVPVSDSLQKEHKLKLQVVYLDGISIKSHPRPLASHTCCTQSTSPHCISSSHRLDHVSPAVIDERESEIEREVFVDNLSLQLHQVRVR